MTLAHSLTTHHNTHLPSSPRSNLCSEGSLPLPIDLAICKRTPQEKLSQLQQAQALDPVSMQAEREKLLEEAKANILTAQKKQLKELYDRKHGKHDGFKVGDLVLRENFRRKKTKGGKLTDKFLGPYEILKVSTVHSHVVPLVKQH